jgi:hypothetical protein
MKYREQVFRTINPFLRLRAAAHQEPLDRDNKVRVGSLREISCGSASFYVNLRLSQTKCGTCLPRRGTCSAALGAFSS